MLTLKAMFGVIVGLQLGSVCSYAQTTQGAQAAAVLARNFETVVYTDSRFLLNFKGDVDHDESFNDLRLPFIELVAGLAPVSFAAENDIEKAYGSLMVGAKDFRNPGGAGLVNSHKCYIATLETGAEPDLSNDFSHAVPAMIDGNKVWTWSLPPGEGAPVTTFFYAGQIAKHYFVLADNKEDYLKAVLALTRGHIAPLRSSSVFNLQDFASHSYWAYRNLKREEVADPESAGIAQIGSDIKAISFYADIAKREGTVRVLTSDADMKQVPNILPQSELYRFQSQGAGIWQAAFPLSRDHAGIERTAQLFTALGSGIYL